MSYSFYYDPKYLYGYWQDPNRQFPLVAPLAIENEFKLGRSGHFYRTHINGFGTAQIQLLSFDPVNEMVHLNIQLFNGALRKMEVHPSDLVGLTYLGPVAPKPLPAFCASQPWHPACQ